MRCVQCGYLEDKVIDTRMSKEGNCIRRRRECLRCGYRYTTYEQIERTELRVVKRDNLHEALNREKILRGMVKACEKRPVSMEQLDTAADDIIAELHRDHQREVPSSIIGMKVIEKLQTIDPVAYIRYVSVYRQFQNVDEFIDLIRRMERTSRIFNDPLQRTLSLN
ncbi:MAG: transcriptional regulator NrdR [Akkermansia sp.]|nr:transcriptional regulator NrdR [Akkermansia sp.]